MSQKAAYFQTEEEETSKEPGNSSGFIEPEPWSCQSVCLQVVCFKIRYENEIDIY